MKKGMLLILFFVMSWTSYAKWYIEPQIGRPLVYSYQERFYDTNIESLNKYSIYGILTDISVSVGDVISDKVSLFFLFGYKQYFNTSIQNIGLESNSISDNDYYGVYFNFGINYSIIVTKIYNLETSVSLGFLTGKKAPYADLTIGGGGRISLINRFFPENDNSLFIALDSDPVLIYLHQPKGFIAVINLSIKLGIRISLTQFSSQ